MNTPTRHTQLGVLPIDVNTIDMLGRALSAAQEEAATLRIRIAQQSDTIQELREQLDDAKMVRISPLSSVTVLCALDDVRNVVREELRQADRGQG